MKEKRYQIKLKSGDVITTFAYDMKLKDGKLYQTTSNRTYPCNYAKRISVDSCKCSDPEQARCDYRVQDVKPDGSVIYLCTFHHGTNEPVEVVNDGSYISSVKEV